MDHVCLLPSGMRNVEFNAGKEIKNFLFLGLIMNFNHGIAENLQGKDRNLFLRFKTTNQRGAETGFKEYIKIFFSFSVEFNVSFIRCL